MSRPRRWLFYLQKRSPPDERPDQSCGCGNQGDDDASPSDAAFSPPSNLLSNLTMHLCLPYLCENKPVGMVVPVLPELIFLSEGIGGQTGVVPVRPLQPLA